MEEVYTQEESPLLTRAQRQKKAKKNSLLSEVISMAITVIVTIFVVFLIQHFIIASFTVSGSSMETTLSNGQRMMMYKLAEPKRFDIIVIDAPDKHTEAGSDTLKKYIKRVIGMPGDTLEYKDDTLYLNGVEQDEPYLDALRAQLGKGQKLMKDFTLDNVLKNVHDVNQVDASRTTLVEKDGKMVIPDGYYFVLGDNRQHSNDSDDYGLVPKSLVNGVAVVRYWPLDKIGIAPFE